MSDAPIRPKVLFVKLSAIGDIVMASGLPANIKTSSGDVSITWLVEAPYCKFIAAHPDIDAVIPWPKAEWTALAKERKWLTLFRTIRAFRRTLRMQNFSLAIDAQGLLKSAFLCWLSGAPRRIGFRSKEHSERLLTECIDKPVSNDICSEYKALGRYLGASTYTMHLPASPAAHAALNAVCGTFINGGNPFIVLCPFTTRPQKHWPDSHWQQLIRDFGARSAIPLVIAGGPADRDHAVALAAGADNVVVVAGLLSLESSGALIAAATAVVGVDTGLTHLAIAHERAVLALFGSTCPYLHTQNSRARVIYQALSCAPCKRRPTCDGAFTCMSNISAAEVGAWLEQQI